MEGGEGVLFVVGDEDFLDVGFLEGKFFGGAYARDDAFGDIGLVEVLVVGEEEGAELEVQAGFWLVGEDGGSFGGEVEQFVVN